MSNELMNLASPELAINGGGTRFLSYVPETDADKVKLFNSINNTTGKMSDLINKTVSMVDCMVEPVSYTKDDGELVEGFRCVIILDDGTSYGCISTGIAKSLRNLGSAFGTLHFPKGIKMEIKQIETKKGRTFTFNLV